MRTAVVLGTRPEIIKMSPVIRELEKKKADYFIVHTGQHYSYSMDRVFFEQLKIPRPDITWRSVLVLTLNRLQKYWLK